MPGALAGAGLLTERITIQSAAAVAVSVTIARSGTTATATGTHGFTDQDFVTIAGATQTEYNGEQIQITVTDSTHFTYTVSGTPATPATGTITAIFVSDAQGGQRESWVTVATVWADIEPMSATEILQAQAIGSAATYSARVYYRGDITPKMRCQWTPYAYAAAKVLEIHAVLPDTAEPRRFLRLSVGERI